MNKTTFAHSGGGTRYWSPLKVYTNTPATGANMADENFVADSIVDVSPYTPMNWYPDYGAKTQAIGRDTTGFVLDKSGASPVLAYRHKPGVTYPVMCKLAPYTNLEWKDYKFSGTVIIPPGSTYDTTEVSILSYFNSNGSAYELKFKQSGVYLNGGRFNDTLIFGYQLSGGDTIAYSMQVESRTLADTLTDGEVSIGIAFSKNGINQSGSGKTVVDQSSGRITEGRPCVKVDLSNISGYQNRSLLPVVFKNITATKTR